MWYFAGAYTREDYTSCDWCGTAIKHVFDIVNSSTEEVKGIGCICFEDHFVKKADAAFRDRDNLRDVSATLRGLLRPGVTATYLGQGTGTPWKQSNLARFRITRRHSLFKHREALETALGGQLPLWVGAKWVVITVKKHSVSQAFDVDADYQLCMDARASNNYVNLTLKDNIVKIS
jgi:hypothetical protein